MKPSIGGTFAALLLAFASHAASQPNDAFFVAGVGVNSCGQYLQAVESDKKMRPANPNPDAAYSPAYGTYIDFADGFLTGAGSIDAPPNRTTGFRSDHPGRMAWLENYCRAHPLSLFVQAMSALRTFLETEGK